MAEKRTRRRFTAEYKAQAVKRLLEGGRGLSEVATELGVSSGQLSTWRTEHLAHRAPGGGLGRGATMLAGTRYLERVHRWDPVTARFASIPGALSSVLVLAAASSADLPRVVLAQSIRIFALVGLMPLILSMSNVHSMAGVATAVSPTNSLLEVLATLPASGTAAAILARLRVPGGMLLGAMLASALLHGADLIHGRFPAPFVIVGLVIMGAVIGARFQGTSSAVLRWTLPGAVGSVILALVISAGFTALGTFFLGLPFGQLWLAYAPGGVEAMAAMALTLQLDPAFVGAHHVLRIIGLNHATAVWLGRRGG